jgi:hypothetical protein
MSHELLLGAIGADWCPEIRILEVYRRSSVLWGVGASVWTRHVQLQVEPSPIVKFSALHVIT